jgi:hypothetical protein
VTLMLNIEEWDRFLLASIIVRKNGFGHDLELAVISRELGCVVCVELEVAIEHLLLGLGVRV